MPHPHVWGESATSTLFWENWVENRAIDVIGELKSPTDGERESPTDVVKPFR